jgi:hypothetical protein
MLGQAALSTITHAFYKIDYVIAWQLIVTWTIMNIFTPYIIVIPIGSLQSPQHVRFIAPLNKADIAHTSTIEILSSKQ